MNRLYEILAATTQQYRTGPVVTVEKREGLTVVHEYAMPHVDEAPDDVEIVDVHFIKIGVRRDEAMKHRDELVAIIHKDFDVDRMKGGPSYIEVAGKWVGDQGATLQLFALGQVMGLWTVITPGVLGITGDEADTMAGLGFVMVSGFKP